ncbi:MAG: LacI family DNA-binding transcriptional regulator [Halothermotrichaceae bacterium]
MSLTLKDIAKMVGVAESTVSRAINNKPGVGKKTKAKIMEIVKEYNYKPNQLAQGLAKNETHMLAIILSDLTTPGYTEIIKSIEAKVNKSGYQLIICNTDNNPQKEKAYLQLLENNRVDGAVIVGGELADKNILNLALNKDNQIVLVNCLAEEMLIPTILIDSSHGSYLATQHLYEQGAEKIAFIMGNNKDFQESEKLDGYKQALKDLEISFYGDYVIETGGTRKDGFDSFFDLMALANPPQAFLATSDLLSVGLTEAVKMGGYFIPDDFLIVGYGESLITSIIEPALTVIAEPLNQLGELAASYLLKLVQDDPLESVIRVLKPVLKMRKSTNPQIK